MLAHTSEIEQTLAQVALSGARRAGCARLCLWPGAPGAMIGARRGALMARALRDFDYPRLAPTT